jgi:hypothetical protein
MKRRQRHAPAVILPEQPVDYALNTLTWLGGGIFGFALRADVARQHDGAHPFTAAVKWIALEHNEDDMEAASPADAVDEVVLAYLLSKLDAPSFPDFFGAMSGCSAPLLGTQLAARVWPNAPPDTALQRARPVMLTVQSIGSRGRLSERVYAAAAGDVTALPLASARLLLFPLVWSKAVAEMKIGLKHRDIALSNLVEQVPGHTDGHMVAAPVVQHYSLFPPGKKTSVRWQLALDAVQGPGVPLLIDFGMSTYYAVPEPGTLSGTPHAGWADVAKHAAPELFFWRLAHEAADLWQLGMVAFSLLAAPHVAPGGRSVQEVAAAVRSGCTLDLIDFVGGIESDTTLLHAFAAVLAAAVPGLDRSTAHYAHFVTYPHSNGSHMAVRFLYILALQDALGQPWLLPTPATHPAASTLWARLLNAPAVLAFWETEARPQLVPRFAAVVAGMDPDALDFVRRALAWDPEARLAFGQPDANTGGGCWPALLHPLFAPLRACATPAVLGAQHAYYQCHVTPALRWGTQPPGDAQHRTFLAEQQAAARQLVTATDTPMDMAALERFLCTTAVKMVNTRRLGV